MSNSSVIASMFFMVTLLVVIYTFDQRIDRLEHQRESVLVYRCEAADGGGLTKCVLVTP